LPAGGLDIKVDGPRILLARLATRQDVAAINRFLQGLTPWAASGSEWDVREVLGWQKSYADKLRIGHRGDYDFTEAGLISILLLFADQPDLLYPDTAQHIVDALVIDKGKAPRPHVPGSLGLVDETENHVLMTESSRYLASGPVGPWRTAVGSRGPLRKPGRGREGGCWPEAAR
jgi:hypothetical protein